MTPSPARVVTTVLAFGVAGWAFCGAIMGVLPPLIGLDAALVVHAIAAPIAFAGLAGVYQRRVGPLAPLPTALIFLGIVVGLDFLLVALVILRSLAMFASALGTWIPFGLLFLASWGAGSWARRTAGRG